MGIANAFSGGIFLCIALLHLLPESAEIFDDYYEHLASANETGIFNNSTQSGIEVVKEKPHFPISFLLAFCGYTLILMFEKIIFDAHTKLIEEEDESEEIENEEENDFEGQNKNMTKLIRQISSNKLSLKNVQPDTSKFGNNESVSLSFSVDNMPAIGSMSFMSRASKRDKVNSYLKSFKMDTEKKEEHFKNLFSNEP